MKKIFRPRNVFIALTVSLVVWIVQFVYRTKNFCEPGDRPIQSEADAIAVAKKKMVKNPFFSSGRFGSAPDFVDALERTDNCCNAIRSRNILGFGFLGCLSGRKHFNHAQHRYLLAIIEKFAKPYRPCRRCRTSA
jgi:hypothetical protein